MASLSTMFGYVQHPERLLPLLRQTVPIQAFSRYIRTSHQNDPWRTLFEILLVLFALSVYLRKRTRMDGEQKNFVKLTEKEIDELVTEWMPEPLVPLSDSSAEMQSRRHPIIVGPPTLKCKILISPMTNHAVLSNSTNSSGQQVDTDFGLMVPSLSVPHDDDTVSARSISMGTAGSASPGSNLLNLTSAKASGHNNHAGASSTSSSPKLSNFFAPSLISSNNSSLINGANGTSQYLSQNTTSASLADDPNIKTKTVLNLASYNFHNLIADQRIKDDTIASLRHFGVGSCGPPGFYGTTDAHMFLEAQLAAFLGMQASVIYSQAFTTSSSMVSAFAKRGDIIVADEGVNFAIRKGIQISRSTVRFYKHNDMQSLRSVLDAVQREAKKKDSKLTRRFIITEGIFENDGSLVDLPAIIELKTQYKYRLILDESFSFGTVGRTGRGVTEYYNLPPRCVDMLIGSMANTLGAAGGFCAGDHVVANHQRINSPAFVFSAALPSLLATAASTTLRILEDPASIKGIFGPLLNNIHQFRTSFMNVRTPPEVVFASDQISPIQHIFFAKESSWMEEDQLWLKVVDECIANGILVCSPGRLRGQEAEKGIREPRSSLLVVLSAGLTKKEIERSANVIRSAISTVLKAHRKRSILS